MQLVRCTNQAHIVGPLKLRQCCCCWAQKDADAAQTSAIAARAHHCMCTAIFTNDACSSQPGGRNVLRAGA